MPGSRNWRRRKKRRDENGLARRNARPVMSSPDPFRWKELTEGEGLAGSIHRWAYALPFAMIPGTSK
jgi:hypothetical protein